MTKLLLSLHVLAAIVAIGPVTVAASMFPRQVAPDGGNAGLAAALHRVCSVYAVVGVSVPVFGLATAHEMGVLTDAWLIASMILTALAAVVLGAGILPAQRAALAAPDAVRTPRLHMAAGVFNLLWAVVVVLMIVRPGSTTGA
ncbi:hypothetical protein [Streptomyces sp. PT12]|uniref:hypothetical protein n=1 Tax=Streptomyces sp. PT12 TaxID=1510197 RepID=UPI000DE4C36C|nr:hypothetical protein [Streptomyces sp. PT12]RBM05522.1 hypothetical protein DEH69_27380 [Streptomyces sp. PT12]